MRWPHAANAAAADEEERGEGLVGGVAIGALRRLPCVVVAVCSIEAAGALLEVHIRPESMGERVRSAPEKTQAKQPAR